jgi:hypothetical protein
MTQPILFPVANRDTLTVYLRQMKQFEAQSKNSETLANLVIDVTANALGVPPGWRLDMTGEVWQFVPPPDESEVLENANEPQ